MMSRRKEDAALRCSFCHKHKDHVGKLISGPPEYDPVYICDECIAVCNSILSAEREEAVVDAIANEASVLTLLQSVERWIERDAQGDATAELATLREIALQIFPARGKNGPVSE
jgi:hypothetical protein